MTIRAAFAVLIVLFAVPAFAQNAPSHGWLDVNFIAFAPAQEAQTYTFRTTISSETATASTAYPALPSAKGGDLGAGVHFGKAFGVGVHVMQAKYDYTVGLAVNIPHPLLFNRFGQDADVTTDSLQRVDKSVDIEATFFVPTSGALVVRVFGGPSYFKVRQEMVEVIRYSQVFNLLGGNSVDIGTYTQREVEGSAWGFNVGADVGYFFSRHVGVGGLVRFNRGTVAIDKEPLTGQGAELKAGGATAGGGLRLRF